MMMTQVVQVDLLVDLPPAHYPDLYEKFEQYFYRNGELVAFQYGDTEYTVHFRSVTAYPQAYMAFLWVNSSRNLMKVSKAKVRDVFHLAMLYALGIDSDTRKHINEVYDFEKDCICTECLSAGWQTSGSQKVIRLALSLYTNGMPSVDEDAPRDLLDECQAYSVSTIFCCQYAPFFWQAIQIRYPEYVDTDDYFNSISEEIEE